MATKYRVWWIPQIPMNNVFTAEVSSVIEGAKMLRMLAAYDMYQLNNHIKPDFSNAGGLEQFDEDEQTWIDWDIEDSWGEYFDKPDEYIENSADISKEQKDEWDTFCKSVDKNTEVMR